MPALFLAPTLLDDRLEAALHRPVVLPHHASGPLGRVRTLAAEAHRDLSRAEAHVAACLRRVAALCEDGPRADQALLERLDDAVAVLDDAVERRDADELFLGHLISALERSRPEAAHATAPALEGA